MPSLPLCLCLAATLAAAASPEWVQVRRSGFSLSPSGAGFIPWGFNFDRDYRHRLIEEYWDAEWTAVERDFREMKRLGANVVRLHLQFAQFMEAPGQPNRANLARLEKLVRLAEELGLYIDVTGLGSYRAHDIPAWYRNLAERDHWAAQAGFWEAIAATCADRPGVFAYNLMNEPLVSGEKRPPGAWLHANQLGGLHYVEYINLDPAGRQRSDIARQWVGQMLQAIRKHDRRHMVTVGTMTAGMSFPHPEEFAGFPPAKIASEVDYISVHLYPVDGMLDTAIDTLRRFRTAKPLVIEETYPLKCGVKEFETFLARSRGIADGWLGFYWGQTPEQLKDSPIAAEKRTYDWLQLFQSMNPNRR